jgi:hypothetical protein
VARKIVQQDLGRQQKRGWSKEAGAIAGPGGFDDYCAGPPHTRGRSSTRTDPRK